MNARQPSGLLLRRTCVPLSVQPASAGASVTPTQPSCVRDASTRASSHSTASTSGAPRAATRTPAARAYAASVAASAASPTSIDTTRPASASFA
ncbi:Uncharacterised protein [Burkholderia pseudomallei]|nr:Uncharacterised protein [Burkholderia pseudomallei]